MSMPGDSPFGQGYPSPTPKVRFDVINQAIQLFQQQFGVWIVVMIIYFVVAGLAAYVLQQIPFLGRYLAFLPGVVLSGGVYKTALKQVRGEVIAPGDVLDVGDVIAPLLVAGIITQLLTAAGLALCIVPGIVFASLWMFTQLRIVDRGMDGVEAMRESWNALRSDMVMATAFAVMCAIIALAGALACGIGMLFTVPVAMLSITVLYRDFFPEGMAGQPDVPFTPPSY